MSVARFGRTWVFGHDINTDLIQPSSVVLLPLAEQLSHVFEANRPGWAGEVRPGDIIVAGRNFGTGSSRPAAKVLRGLGVGAVIAESINGLFFRNCVNLGLPALECPGVLDAFSEGEQLGFDLATGDVVHEATGRRLHGHPWAPALIEILTAGGLIAQLESEDLLLTNTTRE
ncbi:3-isopropylmalate dehydratase [Nocardia cyriacigeorgica]|uniref:LeuD/DmdB family oxidoreductase small subunit n=1 Tax=Nocardia cyriacigeorgica TaxID=135487 RepID=UPI0018936403|nr:3-isopropylmalate dehydratase [Nocardia cyriacigeorgica]MBF6095659.1 3-isopropylmalate dehydratase [Nocardia cyriacigeorgica]MBF6428485.1 3-isopropylmalate dehydratase [Nocardia cyriacigeorgica]